MNKLSEFFYKVIGRSEKISFIDLGYEKIPAKVDTGAKTSAVWATKIKETDQGLEFCLFGPSSPLYTGVKHTAKHFELVTVASSIGVQQVRYKIRLLIKVRGKKIHAYFTLADRSRQAYPILLGRNVLRGKFIVDVKTGRPDIKAEKERSNRLQSPLKKKGD